MHVIKYLLALLVTTLISTPVYGQQLLIFPQHHSANDAREQYGTALLRRIVEGSDLQLQLSELPMTRARMELELLPGTRINIMLLPEKPEYDQNYIKIPIAIDNGLIGQRVAFVRAGSEALAGVETLAQLQLLTGCTGARWAVTEWYERNELAIRKLNDYSTMFIYTERGACDYFSRSVLEIEQEFQQQQDLGRALEIDPHVLLQVPVSQYFYISPEHSHLLTPLTQAIQQAKAQGVLDEALQAYLNSLFSTVTLSNRIVITLQ